MKRRTIACFLIGILVFCAFPCAEADAVPEERATSLTVDPGSVEDLLALGYPEDFVQDMTQQTITAVLGSLDSRLPVYYVNYENHPEPLRMIVWFALRVLLPIVILLVLVLVIRALVMCRRKRKQVQ